MDNIVLPQVTGSLTLSNNQLTTIDVSSFTSLTQLDLSENQLTSIDVSALLNLNTLNLINNQLTSLDTSSLSNLLYLFVSGMGNQLTATVNDSILNNFFNYGLSGGQFQTSGGRTAVGTPYYDGLTLTKRSWIISGTDLIVVGNGKLRVKGVGQL